MSSYMQPQFMGVDETKPGALFVRLVNPTEMDKVTKEMARLIKSYYAGWDLINLDLWRKLGLDVTAETNPLQQFLQNYIQLARETRDSISARNKDKWIQDMQARFGTRTDDLTDYVRAMLDMISAGTMPDVILKPYSYTPTEVGQDVTHTVTSALPKLVIVIAVIGGVMMLSSTVIPQITASVSAARAARRARKVRTT